MSSNDLEIILTKLPASTWETVYMVIAATALACIMGVPLGAFLYSASPGGLNPKGLVYSILSRIVNLFRSLPFIILMILLIPFTRLVVGTTIGSTAAIVPLAIAAAPFVARIVETALSEVDYGVIIAAHAMGSTHFQIIRKVLFPESLPSLVSGLALTMINLIGYSAMAGAIGGGGLGNLAITYGYNRFNTGVMLASVVVILLLVEIIQVSGLFVSRMLLSKR
ncbi:methionine ABC transporter permease [Breznakiellaceae bacterium SP9]